MMMYRITRNGEPVANSNPVPYEAAVLAVMMLNKEHRKRDLFDFEIEPSPTWGERVKAQEVSEIVAELYPPTPTCYGVHESDPLDGRLTLDEDDDEDAILAAYARQDARDRTDAHVGRENRKYLRSTRGVLRVA